MIDYFESSYTCQWNQIVAELKTGELNILYKNIAQRKSFDIIRELVY